MGQAITVRCPACGTLNRVPQDKAGMKAMCGQCREYLPALVWPDAAVEVTDASFDARVRRSGYPVLVEFWSPTCGHCVRMAPVLDELARELRGRAVVAKLDVSSNPATAASYEVRGTPTFVLVKGGKEAARLAGAMARDELLRRVLPFI